MRFSIVRVQMLKELDQFRRDRLTVALAFVLPVIGMLMYGMATRLEAKDIPIAVINYDISKTSRDLVDRFFATAQLMPAKPMLPDILKPLDLSLVRAVIVIPPEFERNLAAGRQATYQALIDGTDVNNARVVEDSLLETTMRFEQLSGLSQSVPLIQPAIRLWYNPGRQESLYIVPGAAALMLWIFPAILATIAYAREKEQGTILQVYASNLTASELIAGKALAYILVGIGEAICLFTVAGFVFGLWPKAGLIVFAVCTILFVSCSVFFGLWAGTLANNQMAAIQIVANLGFLSTMLLSGFIYPVRNVLYPLSLAANFVPAMYYVLICRNEFVRGGAWWGLWPAPIFFAVFCGYFMFILSRVKLKLKG